MTKLTEAQESYARRANRASNDVLAAVAAVRTRLTEIENAIQSGYRVPASVTGEPFIQDDVTQLVRMIDRRQDLHDTAALLAALEN